MTIKELVDKLNQYDPDSLVFALDDEDFALEGIFLRPVDIFTKERLYEAGIQHFSDKFYQDKSQKLVEGDKLVAPKTIFIG